MRSHTRNSCSQHRENSSLPIDTRRSKWRTQCKSSLKLITVWNHQRLRSLKSSKASLLSQGRRVSQAGWTYMQRKTHLYVFHFRFCRLWRNSQNLYRSPHRKAPSCQFRHTTVGWWKHRYRRKWYLSGTNCPKSLNVKVSTTSSLIGDCSATPSS